jgi:tRNA nucleotidyltransferase (CCA-adding enzyme)
MKIYLVGGAVRDKLLGLPIKERDFVVVGATPAEMIAEGYRQVGKEFPVFIHPKTGEEYALARMERKVKPGYTGFTFDTSPKVTLEEDLLRRDLTINAMAEDDNGTLIDPYHGQDDLKAKVLRHVSPAFAEDPVRILRIGRFYARFYHLGFSIAPETLALMQKMVTDGEVDALVPERVWKELERALGEKNPAAFFAALNSCGAQAVLFPEISPTDKGLQALQATSQFQYSPLVHYAVLLHALDNVAIKNIANRYRVPNDYRDLSILTERHYPTALRAKELSADELLALFAALDIFRREERYDAFLQACNMIAHVKGKTFDLAWLKKAAAIAKSYPVQTLLQQDLTGEALAKALREKRSETLANWLSEKK